MTLGLTLVCFACSADPSPTAQPLQDTNATIVADAGPAQDDAATSSAACPMCKDDWCPGKPEVSRACLDCVSAAALKKLDACNNAIAEAEAADRDVAGFATCIDACQGNADAGSDNACASTANCPRCCQQNHMDGARNYVATVGRCVCGR
jgi:hypothetical protein